MSRPRAHTKIPPFKYSKVQELLACPTDPLDVAMRTQHLLRVYRGLSQLEEADAPSQEDWLACSEAIHVTNALIEMGVAADSTDLLDAASHALADVAWFGTDSIGSRLEGSGRDAVREIVDCYVDLLAQVPARTFIQAHRRSEQRLRELGSAMSKRMVADASTSTSEVTTL